MRKKVLLIGIVTICVLFWLSLITFIYVMPNVIEWAIDSNERMIFIENANLEAMPGVQILDANNQFFQISEYIPNHITYTPQKNTNIYLKEAKSRIEKLDYATVQVEAKINDNEYMTTIDTGYGGHLLVNDLVVLENSIEIFPLEYNDPAFSGFCNIDKIQIGDIIITSPPCSYKTSHYERQIFGKTTWKQKNILLGLQLMKNFRYIMIDSISSQVEFSNESFDVNDIESWQSYPFYLKNISQNQDKLIVEIPIEGQSTKIMFDTGYGTTFAMSQSKWSNFPTKLNIIEEIEKQNQMVHGWEDIKKITAEEINICGKVFTNINIDVFEDSSRFGKDFFLLGMDCFADTIIVLDFENNLFRVKQTTD